MMPPRDDFVTEPRSREKSPLSCDLVEATSVYVDQYMLVYPHATFSFYRTYKYGYEAINTSFLT